MTEAELIDFMKVAVPLHQAHYCLDRLTLAVEGAAADMPEGGRAVHMTLTAADGYAFQGRCAVAALDSNMGPTLDCLMRPAMHSYIRHLEQASVKA